MRWPGLRRIGRRISAGRWLLYVLAQDLRRKRCGTVDFLPVRLAIELFRAALDRLRMHRSGNISRVYLASTGRAAARGTSISSRDEPDRRRNLHPGYRSALSQSHLDHQNGMGALCRSTPHPGRGNRLRICCRRAPCPDSRPNSGCADRRRSHGYNWLALLKPHWMAFRRAASGAGAGHHDHLLRLLGLLQHLLPGLGSETAGEDNSPRHPHLHRRRRDVVCGDEPGRAPVAWGGRIGGSQRGNASAPFTGSRSRPIRLRARGGAGAGCAYFVERVFIRLLAAPRL